MDIIEQIQRLSYKLSGDQRYRYFDKLTHNISLQRKEILEYQGNLIYQLVNHAYTHTNYYKRVMNELNLKPDDFQCREDLNKLPVLTKSIIKKHIEDIKSTDHHSHNLIEVTSGGSTGNQARIFKSQYFNQISRASALRNNLICGWKPSDKSVWIWGAPYEHQQIQDSLKSKLGIFINRRILFNAFNYSYNDFQNWVYYINNFKPKIIYGYASIIREFSNYLIDKNIRLNSVQLVVSTTEKLEKRETIKEAFKCKVVDQYGCREILGIGIETSEGCMLLADDNVALNLDEANNFIITALHSYGFPLINYMVGDKGSKAENLTNCDQSLPFSYMNLKIGRMTDNFITTGQKIVSSSALATYISTFNIPFVEYQLIQLDFNKFEINYVSDSNFDLGAYQMIINQVLTEYFGDNPSIKYNRVERVKVEKSGKKLLFKRSFGDDIN